MKIFLNGGGSGKKIEPMIKKFGSLLDYSKPILYIPLAMSEEKYDDCLEWFKKEMSVINLVNIEMVRNGQELLDKKLNEYCALFIGGGNTYKLLKTLKTYDMFTRIKDFANNSGVIFGGSAGAIIFGQDIDTALYSDENNVNLNETNGLNFLNGASLLCHLGHNKEETEKNINYLLKYSKNKKVYYLPEENTIFINNNCIEIFGDKEYYIFENGKMTICNNQKKKSD